MAGHTWDTRPTRHKANRIIEAFLVALGNGWSSKICRHFAGYYCEQAAMNSRRAQHVIGRARNGYYNGFYSYTHRRDSANYLLCFNRHLPIILADICNEIGLAPDTPGEIIADKLRDLDRYGAEAMVRAMIAE